MKILIAVDGSEPNGMMVRELVSRPWPSPTEVRVLSVAHVSPQASNALLPSGPSRAELDEWEHERAKKAIANAARQLESAPHKFAISTKVLTGSPKEQIVNEAQAWKPDLLIVGSHGQGPPGRFLLGSVAASVAFHAPCSVEIVRSKDGKQPE